MPFDVTPETFDEQVIAGSRATPVLVDFWAPWCAPCRQVAPVLEDLERESGGRWRLAKANTEAHPALGQRFAVTAIPALKLFVDGAIAAESVGALTRLQLTAWLDGFVPGEERALAAAARQAEARGEDDAARALYEQALQRKPLLVEARAGLARVLARGGEIERARELVAGLAGPAAAAGRLEVEAEAGPGPEAARAAAAGTDPPPAALLDLGVAEMAAGRADAAVEALLEAVRRDAGLRAGAARARLLDVFEVLGPDSELARDARRRLAMLLY